MHRPLGFRVSPAAHERRAQALLFAAAVVLVHVLVLGNALPHRPVAPERAPTLQVRQIVHTAEAAVAAAEAAITPPAAPAAPARPRKPTPVAALRATAAAPEPPPSATVEPTAATASPSAAWLPTRVPPSTELVYVLVRGPESGEARLSWQVDGERYALAFQARLPSGREVDQHSQGGFDASGLAPLRLADRRRGRDVRAANFQREHGKVTFSGPRWELPLQAGTQDRLSWLVQLVALAGGATEGLRDGSELAMWVVGARGAASHWRFEVRGVQRLTLPERAADTLWLVREPLHPYDVRVEVWLDPQRGHWPLKLRQTQIPGGEALEWLLRDEPRPGT